MTPLLRAPRRTALIAVLALGALVGAAAVLAASSSDWPMGGQNLSNTRSNPSSITRDNAKNLRLKWQATVHGDVSATPAVVGGAVYFPDWAGYLNKLDASTGAVIWQKQISDYTGNPGQVARTAPAVDGNTLYIGTQNTNTASGGQLISINATTGAANWVADISNGSFFAIATQSPIVSNGVVYEGVASAEEGVVAFVPGYQCCHDRGSFSAVRASDGAVLWTTPTVPDIPGYSGNGVWAGTAALDPSTNTVYIATGNNYSVPQSVKDCEAGGGTPQRCLASDNYVDSILALDTASGAIKWASKLAPGFDDWNVACIIPQYNPSGCPTNPGPDYDFGSGPNLFTIGPTNKPRKVVGAGQKSGDYWLLDAATGAVIWKASPGPGSTLGGIEWGTATDGKKIYAAETNYNRTPYKPVGGNTINYGSWVAIDANSGKVVWQTPDPEGGITLGPTTVSQDVVYAGSLTGDMYAMDAQTGKILWSYQGQGASNASPAVVGNTVYWGNGYSHLGIPEGTPSTTFYAFSLNGN